MISSPTLLVDEQKCRANIKRMVQKARNYDLEFRPHFKTHQSADIGEWFRDEGVAGITVSSVKMALYFAKHSWEDITIAFPINIREIKTINKLAYEISITILVSDPDVCEALRGKIEHPIRAMVEIDTGSNRTGFRIDRQGEINNVVSEISEIENLQFSGFYSHPGHSYSARSQQEIKKVHSDVLSKIDTLANAVNIDRIEYSICIGDTPCSSVATNFIGIDQISPGNLVFFDLMQVQIGSCTLDDIAVAVACPVVAKYPARSEIVIHGGAVHLSKEMIEKNEIRHFGYPVHLTDDGWHSTDQNGYLKALSQEHGIVKCSTEFMDSVQVGDLIAVLPVHSCLCADLMGGYRSLDGRTLNHIRKQA